MSQAELLESRVIKVRLSAQLPIDPSRVNTMADYDMALLLSRTWFEYDSSRKATSGLIEKWTFAEKEGGYYFKISPHAKWSDGKHLTANDLFLNLKRGIDNPKSTYGMGMKGIIDISSFRIVSDSEFFVATISKKPTEAFFQRMGSIFWAVTCPDDFSDPITNHLKSNTRSIGPYEIISITDEEIILERNRFYFGDLHNSPTRIIIKKPTLQFKLEDFINGSTWENYVQLNTLIDKSHVDKIIQKKYPIWTRGADRVSLLRPHGKGSALQKRKNVGLMIAKKIHEIKRIYPLNVTTARSLQPVGYPLNSDLSYVKISTPKISPLSKIRILTYESSLFHFHKNNLKPIFDDLKIEVEWIVKDKDEYFDIIYYNKTKNVDRDFDLVGFGVADPEPATWLGLVFGSQFISYSKKDLLDFEKIVKKGHISDEVPSFRRLIEKIQSAGGFVPLFFYSTLSIGKLPMDFSNIRELDETVDYSKIIFK